MAAVIVNVTHHQRGADCSTTPEIRSVSQLKFRLFRTSGTRASGRSDEITAPPCNASGTVDALSMFQFRDPHDLSSGDAAACSFSAGLATPILLASGIFGLGLRMRAR